MSELEMFKKIQEDAVKRYSQRYEKLGVVPQALGWGCKEDQLERFQVITKYNDLSNQTILDIGCGFGDFYVYLKEKQIPCTYIGIDIIPQFISHCKEQFPEAEFYDKNILLDFEDIPEADYVISLGTLNYKLTEIDNIVYTDIFMEKAFQKARQKLILDFLSTRLTKDYPREDFVYYHEPKEILDMAFSFTENVELIHNYGSNQHKQYMVILGK
ncbi:class I SAM-dependent methyltransferase [Anaeromicropila populeti]|uniref:Methyltransferase domain-containing protein n=1 Tax=Anaeromicropila populeti TaxID=37658 RepID=A0A1I6HVY0_9FIRM|nr:class I SAM-dependent methyltransferase [Anaeromicropila populeti]SFR58601.1 Methyltransferase domain-containing protein [Anaeromicropila populeti]